MIWRLIVLTTIALFDESAPGGETPPKDKPTNTAPVDSPRDGAPATSVRNRDNAESALHKPARRVSENSVDALLQKFSSAKFSWLQAEVARELVALGDQKAIPAMEKYLQAEDRATRCNAALVLAGLGDKRAVAIVIRELEDREPRPTDLTKSDGKPWPEGQIKRDRYYAAHLLGQLRNKEAVPALIEAMKDESVNYRAAISLGEIGDKSAIPALRAMGKDFPDQRLWAGYGLAALGELEGFDILTEVALSDPIWVQRRHAVEALGTIGDPRAVPTAVKALNDKHANVRVSAAEALGKIGDPTALPALTEKLSDKSATEVNAPRTVDRAAQKAIEAIEANRK